MDTLTALVPLHALIACLIVGFVAGVVKGMVGFAMPMIMISGMGSFVSPELALAGLILPTLVTNGWQAMRQDGLGGHGGRGWRRPGGRSSGSGASC